MTRKITTILLALALCLTLLPVGAGAVDTPSGKALTSSGGQLKCDNTDVTATNENLTVASNNVSISGYVLNDGAYYLEGNVTINKPLIITGGTEEAPVTLDLCGHVLKLNSSIYDGTAEGSVIAVKDGAYFVLKDSSPSEKHYFTKDTSNLYTLDEDTSPKGNIELTGGVITGGTGTYGSDNKSKYGGGVLVGGGAHFEMTGGNIVGCRATADPSRSGCGGGVYISNSATSNMTTFNMTGGCIVGCAANDGGGVSATGSNFTLSGGAIRSCTASSGGGGVVIVNDSTFTMENGTIEGCSAPIGGGVFIQRPKSTFNMVNGTIKGCTATNGNGNGVYIDVGTTMDAQGGSVGGSVYILSSNGTLTNTSTTGGGTVFYGGITNNGGSTTSDKWVTFMNGNNIHAQSIVSSSGKVIKPADPQITGKTFLGWFTKSMSNNNERYQEFDFDNDTVSGDLTLYAAWDGDFAVEVSGAQGGNGYYKTFDAAWSGAQGDSPTFKLLKDVDDVEDITCYRKGATLDLNGHKLTTANFSISGGTGEGDERVFTVEDTSSNGDGKLDGTVTVTGSKAELTVDGGTVDKVVVTDGGTLKCISGKITTLNVYDGGTVNHTGTLGAYDYDEDNHWQVCSRCGTETEKVAHDFSSSNTCDCGYEKPRRTYRGSSTPTVSAVLSHPDAASATNYTSGIYGLTFRSTASFASFRGVQVDGKTIASSNYIAEEGSIVVYLKAVYLQTLSKGSHTVTILSTEGNTTANFTIGGVQSAKTGDAGVAIYALMALTSYTGTALVVRGRKRK